MLRRVLYSWDQWGLPSSESRGFVPVIWGCEGQDLGASCSSHCGVCCKDNEGLVEGPHPSDIDAIDVNRDLSFLQ